MPWRTSVAVLLAALLLVGPLAGAAPAAPHTVVLRDFAFSPKRVTIDRGDRVTWSWRDGGIRHNVVAKRFRSATKSSGTYSKRFRSSGTVRYRCTLHFGMRGVVVVR